MNEFAVVKVTEIKVREDLPRIRKDLGKIKELAESFKSFGQMQPCVVNREMHLIAGGRRLAACIEAGIDVKVVFADTVDPVIMKEMELEENIQRKALTPAEEVIAISELHELKQQIHGAAIPGSDKGIGWKLDDTAEVIGKTRSTVIEAITLADALKNFPVLANCKTKSDIKRAVKGLQRITDSVAAQKTYTSMFKDKEDKFEMHNIDCIEFMTKMKDESVDVLLTDPPYGVDIHDIAIGLGGHTGSKITTTGITYDDSYENSMELIGKLAIESNRIVKSNGFAMVFCAISNFSMVKALFEAAGWLCSQRPVIWIKNNSGQNNAPSKWFSAGYEALLFARKIDSCLVIEGKVDWIQFPLVPPSSRIHQAEKPVALLKELLSRVAMASAIVFDPFAGSHATTEACLDLNMYPITCELSVEAFSVAKTRIHNYFKLKGE